MSGPLTGIRVVEMAGIGPGPFAGMMLADMGADVLRIERPASAARAPRDARFDINGRGKRSLVVDLKSPDGCAQVLALVERADALIEGFRPGVMERLGLGPEPCLARNPRLVYGRMTGWGQHGPLAAAAGHDLNYIAISGMLGAMGRAGEPMAPPLNLVGDYGGGAMMLAFGIACGLIEARGSGRGQVIDAAMSDGAALLGALLWGLKGAGRWTAQRGSNFLDGAAPYYDTYACADGKYVAVGSVEPEFYALLLRHLGLDAAELPAQNERAQWPALKQRFAALFRQRTRAEWCALMEGSDVCFAPVLDMDEAPAHAHNVARKTFVEVDGVLHPAPAPRFSRTPAAIRPPRAVATLDAVLAAWPAAAA
ncbi:MAG: CoA transferase [Proteobacteria bacterium]|nr:CoA transferase [Pseudomonadota bacterium]